MNALEEKVKGAGIVGAGGAGFPTYVKLQKPVEAVIANGAECEPLLAANQELMARYPSEVVKGLAQVVGATQARRGILALKKKYHAAWEALAPLVKPPLKLFPLDDFYPVGDEQVLVYEVLGRKVPAGGIPLAVDAVVSNVETLYNVAQDRPVLRKMLTVTGEVVRPYTAWVPVGTPYSVLVDRAGGSTVSDPTLVAGGPMMGTVVDDWATPVSRTTGGLLVLPMEHPIVVNHRRPLGRITREAASRCFQCRDCTFLCPRFHLGQGIEPHRVMRQFVAGAPITPGYEAKCCSECGLCELFACPMGLMPRKVNRERKELAPSAVVTLRSGPVEEVWHRVPGSRIMIKLGLAGYEGKASWRPEPLDPGPEVKIPLNDFLGAPARALVREGMPVKAGQRIAEPIEGKLGVPVHASVDGTVRQISAGTWIRIEVKR